MATEYRRNPRKERRFEHQGLVYLHSGTGKPLRARGRDLGRFGIGIEFSKKLKTYRLGAEVELEFAMPNHLRGLRIKVKLRRVYTDDRGYDHCGFAIIDKSDTVKKRINEIVLFYEKMIRR